jgi:hypothetical protein
MYGIRLEQVSRVRWAFLSNRTHTQVALAMAPCLLILAMTSYGRAQATASLEGVVSDPTGALLARAEVTATSLSTGLGRKVTTGADGYYRIASLPVGGYDISVMQSGFKRTVLKAVTLTVGQVARVDITMQIGDVQQEVTVQGTVPLIDATTTGVGGVVENNQIMAMPLNGRHFLQLGLLIPGVSEPQAGSTQAQWGTAGGNIGFSVAGQRDSYNDFTLDGVNVMDTNYNTVTVSPSVDAVQEFRIIADGYSAKYGIVPGAQVDIVTRSGTNLFHGSAYEYLRNSALDAKNYFDDPNKPIPPYKQNQFGATVGGPIKKDRAFFFLSYEGLRIRQSLTQETTVPTAAMHNGDLSGINPGTGQPFPQITDVHHVPYPGNQVPLTAFNSMAAGILELTPLPNINTASPGQSNYLAVASRYDNSNVYLGRIDYQLTPKNLAFIRYIQQQDDSSVPFVQRFSPVLPGPNGFGDVSTSYGRNADIAVISSFTPALVNSFHLGWNELDALVESQNIDSNFIQNLGYFRYGATMNHGIPYISIPGMGGTGDNDTLQPNIRRNNGYEFRDDLSWTRGRFTHEFGGDDWLYFLAGVTDTFSNGEFEFGSDHGFGQNVTGSGFSDFLLDRPRVSLIQLGVGYGHYRYNYLGMYYAGQYRATQRLTLNFGLRWEFSTSPTPVDGTVMSVLDMKAGAIVLGSQSGTMPSLNDPLTQYFIRNFGTTFMTNRQLGLPAAVNPTYYPNLAPRFGFAWDAFANGQTVVRGSVGLYNSFQERGYSVESGSLGPPFAPTVATFQDSLYFPTTPNTYETTFAFGGPIDRTSDNGGPSTAGVPPGVRPGYVEEWTLGVQSMFGRSTVFELSYAGNHGVHLNGFYLADQNYPNTAQAPGGYPPNTEFGESFQEHSQGMSWYNGLSARVQRRMTSGLTFTVGYTWARSEDTVSTFTGGPTDSPVPQNSYDISGNKGLSNFDRRNRFIVNYVWELPFGQGKRFLNRGGVANVVLGGWQWGGLATVESGTPFTVQLTSNVSGIASSNADRPNCVSNPNEGAPDTVQEWFNVNAFAPNTTITPATGSPYQLLGTCGRNIVQGPPVRDFDTTLAKTFPLTERVNLEFRTDFFDVLNHPNFNDPNRYYATATFGQITSAALPRLIQFGLRLSF